jgi:hypothetical protein
MNETIEQPVAETPPRKRTIWGRRIVIILIVFFVGIQFYQIDRDNPEVVAESDFQAPDDIKAILRRSCYDCHSHETHWPWYSYIAPGSWLMARDVADGRDALNFSTWGEDFGDEFDDEEYTAEMFRDTCWDSIDSGRMPLWFYLPLHPEAVLTPADLEKLKKWARVEDEAESADGEETLMNEEEVTEEDEASTLSEN